MYSHREVLNNSKPAVIPAKAGIHLDLISLIQKQKWIPAFAGMTTYLEFPWPEDRQPETKRGAFPLPAIVRVPLGFRFTLR